MLHSLGNTVQELNFLCKSLVHVHSRQDVYIVNLEEGKKIYMFNYSMILPGKILLSEKIIA